MVNLQNAWKRRLVLAIIGLLCYVGLPLIYGWYQVDSTHRLETLNAPFYCLYFSSNVAGGCGTLLQTDLVFFVWGAVLVSGILIILSGVLGSRAGARRSYSKGAFNLAILEALWLCLVMWGQWGYLMALSSEGSAFPISPWAVILITIIQLYSAVVERTLLLRRRI